MPWSVYIVRCNDGSLYTGISTDVAQRIATHNAGNGATYTRSRRPVNLVWAERKRSESAARKREYAIKQLTRIQKETLIRSRSLTMPFPLKNEPRWALRTRRTSRRSSRS